MNIRKATQNDKNEVAQVLKASYNIKSIEEGEEVFQNETLKGHHYIIAEENKKIVGIISWLPHGLPKHGLAELDRIAVLPEMKGKGVAKELKDALVKECQERYTSQGEKLRKLYLLTHEDNERARRFYEKMGFSHETTLKEHYYKGKDECVYSIFFE